MIDFGFEDKLLLGYIYLAVGKYLATQPGS